MSNLSLRPQRNHSPLVYTFCVIMHSQARGKGLLRPIVSLGLLRKACEEQAGPRPSPAARPHEGAMWSLPEHIRPQRQGLRFPSTFLRRKAKALTGVAQWAGPQFDSRSATCRACGPGAPCGCTYRAADRCSSPSLSPSHPLSKNKQTISRTFFQKAKSKKEWAEQSQVACLFRDHFS